MEEGQEAALGVRGRQDEDSTGVAGCGRGLQRGGQDRDACRVELRGEVLANGVRAAAGAQGDAQGAVAPAAGGGGGTEAGNAHQRVGKGAARRDLRGGAQGEDGAALSAWPWMDACGNGALCAGVWMWLPRLPGAGKQACSAQPGTDCPMFKPFG